MGVAAAYRACARVTRAQATNFYYAFLSLPRAQRRSVYALYAFCREADNAVDDVVDALFDEGRPRTEKCAASPADLLTEKRGTDGAFLHDGSEMCGASEVDGAFLPDGTRSHSTSEAEFVAVREEQTRRVQEALAGLRERLSQAAAATPSGLLTEKRGMDGAFLHDGSGAVLRDVALADTIARYGVRPADLADVICGMEMDLTVSRYASYDELHLYCYRVASAVGLATLPILTKGRTPTDEMRDRAIALGQGMQLVNILRDVAEDAARDRIYIPQDALRAFGVSEADVIEGRCTDAMKELLASVAGRARVRFDIGRRLIGDVPRSSSGCLWLLAELYGRILNEIEARDFDVFSARASLPKREKLSLLASTFWRRG